MTADIYSREHAPVVSLLPDVLDHTAAIERTADLVRRGQGGYVCFSTVHMVMESYDSPEFGALVNAADMIVPDGMPIVWMQKLQGKQDAARVRANDLMIMLCRYAEEHEMTVGFYGGAPDVIDAILARVKSDFTGLRVAYAFSPPFRPLTVEEDELITAEIRDAGPDILFVGLGCPKQESWMAAHNGELSSVLMGVGASFDFFAGNVKESPLWISGLGFEWLYRLFQEPKRLWRRYLILNPRFMWLSVRQLLSAKRSPRDEE
ncbi:MAG: WecB/TagA/CpsF family glycosyltransferase [Pyrinomonadaceae bacterium]